MPTITGDAGANTLVGTAEGDLIEGLGGNDTLSGLGDADRLTGDEGDDILRGGDGDDVLHGGPGADTLDGGSGFDIASYWAATGGVRIDLNLQGAAQDTGEGLDLLTSIENLEGSAFDDVLTGDGFANVIYDSAGGRDVLSGGGGDDEIRIGRGAHPDSFAFEWVIADGGAGDDIVSLNAFNLDAGRITIDGDAGNDVLLVEGVNLGNLEIRMNGGAGNDLITIVGASGADVHGGDGDDVITIDVQGHFNIDLGTGTDRLVLTGTPPVFSPSPRIWVENFTAGAGGDVIDLSTFLMSASLTNFPVGSNPFETGHLRLVDVNADIIQLEFSASGAGDYSVLLQLGLPRTALSSYNFGGIRPVPTIVSGTGFGDTLQGIEDSDTLNGLGGQDTLVGGGGDDMLNGGEGNDLLFGDYFRPDSRANGDDVLNGGAGNDVLVGGGGDDALTGGDGQDILITGVAVSETAFPPTYSFTPVFDHGLESAVDVLDGGAGLDIAHLLYGGATQAVVFDNSNEFALNQITVGGANRGSVTAVEVINVYGGSAGDILGGGRFNDLLVGNAGDDTLSGGLGEDNLLGEAGDDILDGGAGDDAIIGGGGWDTLLLRGSREDYRVLHSGDDFIVKGLDGTDRLTGVEVLRFSDGRTIDLARQYGDSGPQVLPAIASDPATREDAPLASRPDADADDYVVKAGSDDPQILLTERPGEDFAPEIMPPEISGKLQLTLPEFDSHLGVSDHPFVHGLIDHSWG